PELPEQLAAVAGALGAEQLERLGHPQPVGQRGRLELAAHQRPKLLGLCYRVEAQHPQPSVIGLAQPLNALHGGRLAGAVGADQADDLAGGDVEVKPVHYHPGPVRLAETSHGHYLWLAHGTNVPAQARPARQATGRTSPPPSGRESRLAEEAGLEAGL